jgi:hypothetical protein
MNQLRSAVRPTGLNSKRTESPRNATPITTPTKLAWAKIRTAAPIAAASNQSDLIGAFFPSAYAVSGRVRVSGGPTTGGRLTTDLGARATDTSQLWPEPSFTTVTVSPVTSATQRAAESALA